MPGQKVAATLSSGNRRETAPLPRDIIGFDAMSTVEARHTRLPGNQERELDKLLGGSVCLFRPKDMNHRCQEGVESVSTFVRTFSQFPMRAFTLSLFATFNAVTPDLAWLL
jgi:hypothetical protein